MAEERPPEPSGPDAVASGTVSIARLEALSDGVFAIAMTVMALELTAAVSADAGAVELWAELWPRLIAFAMSFAILGLFWLGQHAAFARHREAPRPDSVTTSRAHAVAVMIFLLSVAAIPLPAAVVGTHPDTVWAFAVYGGMLTLSAALLEVMVRFGKGAEHHPAIERRLGVAVASYAACASLAFVHPYLALGAFFLSHAAFLAVPLGRHAGTGRDLPG